MDIHIVEIAYLIVNAAVAITEKQSFTSNQKIYMCVQAALMNTMIFAENAAKILIERIYFIQATEMSYVKIVLKNITHIVTNVVRWCITVTHTCTEIV